MNSTGERGKISWEDIVVGQTTAFGRTTVTREEIIAFAQAFDPQPFHLDDEAAKSSMVGRLCASGWHSCAMMMRMVADEFLNTAASLGSPGMDDVKWMKPVFPGDILSGRYTCQSKRVLSSRPHVGLCQMLFETLNQDNDVVMTWSIAQLIGLRNPQVRP